MTGRPARPARRLVINWSLVEQRRIAAGLTQAQLADRVGAGAATGRGRLWTDNDHDGVSLGLLERLCRVLDLHPTELFCPPTRVAQRRALPPVETPTDVTVLEAALATLTAPTGGSGVRVAPAALADALGWSLDRLTIALTVLTERLSDTGIRVDTDPAPTGTPVRGLRARDRHLTDDQRTALHRLDRLEPPLDAEAARVLDAIARTPRGFTERDRNLDPAALIALQQRGLIRRHHRGDYLELTDDASFSLRPGR